MFIDVKINFSVVDGDGWCGAVSDSHYLWVHASLIDQVKAAVDYWIDSKNRIFNADFRLSEILFVFFCHKGYCHVIEIAGNPRASWPLHLN